MEVPFTVVRGTILDVIRVSKVFGLAPVTIKPVNNGFRIAVSCTAAYCSYIVYAIFFCFSLTHVTLEVTLVPPVRGFSRLRRVGVMDTIVIFSDLILLIIISGLGFCYGFKRYKDIIRNLDVLKKLTSNQAYSETRDENRAIILLTLYAGLRFCCLLLNTILIYMEEREEPRIIMRTVYEFQHIITTILEFQIIFMGFEFQKTLASIADELSHLNAQIKTGNKEIVISNSVPSIRSSATLYTETCDVVERFNACNGLLVFSFIILYTLQLVFTADSLANTLQYNKLNSRLAVNCCLDVMWLLFHNIRTIIFIQPWHRISKEVCQIKIQLGKLLQGLAAYEKEILWESKVFYTEVMINNAELKPLGLFTVSRYLFVQIMSVVITYTLVVVQLRN